MPIYAMCSHLPAMAVSQLQGTDRGVVSEIPISIQMHIVLFLLSLLPSTFQIVRVLSKIVVYGNSAPIMVELLKYLTPDNGFSIMESEASSELDWLFYLKCCDGYKLVIFV